MYIYIYIHTSVYIGIGGTANAKTKNHRIPILEIVDSEFGETNSFIPHVLRMVFANERVKPPNS